MVDVPPTVRRAGLDDAAILADLGARTFGDAFGNDNTPEDMAHYLAANFTPAQLGQEIATPGAAFFLALAGERPVGYAKLTAGVATPDCVTGPSPIGLSRFYVDQAVQGRGYSHALMAVCLDQAKASDYETVWLSVWEHNPRAVAFYRKWAFEVVGQQEFVLGSDVQNDYVMSKRLD